VTDIGANRDRITARLKVVVLIGATLLFAGVLLACLVELSTAAWITEAATGPGFSDDEGSERWLSSTERDGKLRTWAFRLMPLGAGTLAGAILSLLFVLKGRFRLRSLLLGTLYMGVLLGILFGVVRPRLQNPRVWYRAASGDIAFTQIRYHADSTFSSNSTFSLLNRQMAILALVPSLAVPLIVVWSMRRRRLS
jgi:hypothetical protein